ncbi:class I SAM-dependent RNA methyltransferase [Treponema primitia]|uniref:THUMP domain-containing class I SAM-dependent RNA methyltransferase n=1 Tax=Treponema primitia TaxID=88058 RepID=UPI00397FF2BF
MITVIALCGLGVEKVVSNEIRKLSGNYRVLESGFGRVRFETDIPGIYRALMALRCADRLLLEMGLFPAADFDALFEGVKAIPWEAWIPAGMGIRVAKVRSNRSKLQGITTIQAMTHKAAADRLCEKYRQARLDETGFQAELRVYVEKDQVSVLLDLSGEPLFKRGYRTEGGAAPLRETTAASLLLLANWRRKFPLYDPFCGSGTIAIEAALYAWDAAPGLGRRFTLSDLIPADAKTEAAVREELLGKVNFERTIRIYGSDSDVRSVSIAKSNIQRAYELAQGKSPGAGIRPEIRLPWLPEFRTVPMKAARLPEGLTGERGFIITNPPYGKRLGEVAEAETIYREMSDMGKQFPLWKLAVITDHPGFESHFGRKADSCRELTNGALDSYFYEYTAL